MIGAASGMKRRGKVVCESSDCEHPFKRAYHPLAAPEGIPEGCIRPISPRVAPVNIRIHSLRHNYCNYLISRHFYL